MSRFLILLSGIILVEVVGYLSNIYPMGHKKWRWWELKPTGANAQPSQARKALAFPREFGRRRNLTIVRLRQDQRCRVWVSFLSRRDDGDIVRALATAAGCAAAQDEIVPIAISKKRWRISHIRQSENQDSREPPKLDSNEADKMAARADNFLNEGDVIITTIRWTTEQQVKARVATTSKHLPTRWTHEASTWKLIPWPSLAALFPIAVIIASTIILVDDKLNLYPLVDNFISYLAGNPGGVTVSIAIVALVHSFWRFALAWIRPRIVQRVQNCWFLPIGWWVRRRGATVNVDELTGWARARP